MNQRKIDKENFYIVGIGASAGGLEALEKFFDNMPPNNGMAFIVVQHLSPDYKSMMVEILSKHTSMQVLQAEDGVTVEPNNVYLIPRKKNMTIFHGKLYLTEKDTTRGFLNLPIDIFFDSLAQDQHEKAIAIVMSGTGSDGTRGIRAIKETDGMVMVQDHTSAKFDGMPKSAISTALVDYILPVEKMPEELLKYIQHPYISRLPKTDPLIRDEDTLSKLLAVVQRQLDVDFSEYKQNTVIRRIQRRMGINQIDKITDYLKYIQQSPQEVSILYKEMLIGVTKFFRDQEAFEALQRIVIPKIFESKKPRDIVRVWVAGCSTGEEAYSLAILFAEYIQKTEKMLEVKIFATEIDKNAIDYASIGLYPESIAAEITIERLQRYFVRRDDKYQVNRQIRQMVIFAKHNLLKDPPFGKIDLVSCRNVLIYMQPVLQERILSFFHFSMKNRGFLFLGNSETIGEHTALFTPIDNKSRIYQFNDGYKNSSINRPNMPTVREKTPEVQPAPYMASKYLLSKNTTQRKLSDIIYQAVMDEYVPPFVVINQRHEIIHTNGNLEDYLRMPQGEMSFELAKLLREELSAVLGTAVHSVMKNNKKLFYNLNIRIKEEYKNLNLQIIPLQLVQEELSLVVIFFEENKQITPQLIEKSDFQENFTNHILDLEQELQYTRESLQATVEELETSNEELQATNEELLAANEELQSTNEELQSVNEELMTINAEYQYKIEELMDVNNDINNLMRSTHIGTIFLDKHLSVKRFTPDVTEEFFLMDFDIGRPIQHISHNLKYTTLLDNIRDVLQTTTPYEIEVESQKGKWYLLRILPYLTVDRTAEGVVITLVDITERHRFADSRLLLATVAESLEEALVGLSLEGKIISWNKSAEKIYGYSLPEVQEKSIFDFLRTEQRIEFIEILEKTKRGERIEHFETIITHRMGTKIPVSLKISPIRDAQGHILGASKIVHDLTQYKRLEDKLQHETYLSKYLMEIHPDGIIWMDIEGYTIFTNKRATDILGLDEISFAQHLYRPHEWDILDEADKPIPEKDSFFKRIMKNDPVMRTTKHRIKKSNGHELTLLVNGMGVFDDLARPSFGVIFAFKEITKADELN